MRKAMSALTVVLASVLSATACVKQQVVAANNVGPSLVVEQFLRAANAQEWSTLGKLFGTKDGPIASRDNSSVVEQRMALIGRELKHEDFTITAEQAIPGRNTEATKLTVKIKKDGKDYNVPFTLVRYKQNTWLIEQIGLDVITSPR
jgi:hypothetical protein